MSFISVPIIVIICYLIAELYKFVFKNKKELYKIIPVIVGFVGGMLGLLIYLTDPIVIFNVDSILEALEIGFISGLSSTGANQIKKKLISGGIVENE